MIVSFENCKKIMNMEDYFDNMSLLRLSLIIRNYEKLCKWLDHREECIEEYSLEKTEENKAELDYAVKKVRFYKAIQRILEGTTEFNMAEIRRWNIKRAAYMKCMYGIELRRFNRWNTQDGHYTMK